jgi:hypothetical protein
LIGLRKLTKDFRVLRPPYVNHPGYEQRVGAALFGY